jgi:hypothetical protein
MIRIKTTSNPMMPTNVDLPSSYRRVHRHAEWQDSVA